MVGGGVAPARLPHTVAVTARGPKGAASLLRAVDANSVSGGNKTKAHAGSSHFRMRIINLTPCIERSQCRGKSNKPYQLLGGIRRHKRGVGLGQWRSFFFPKPVGTDSLVDYYTKREEEEKGY